MGLLAGERERACARLPGASSCMSRPPIGDPSRLGVEEAEQEIGDRGLAGSALADERYPAARLDQQIEAVEHRRPVPRRTAP